MYIFMGTDKFVQSSNYLYNQDTEHLLHPRKYPWVASQLILPSPALGNHWCAVTVD